MSFTDPPPPQPYKAPPPPKKGTKAPELAITPENLEDDDELALKATGLDQLRIDRTKPGTQLATGGAGLQIGN